MHIGFVIRQITEQELSHKCIYIHHKDRELFPKPSVLFFIDSYDDTFGAYINEEGFISGIEQWFETYPHRPDDTVIISKTSNGFSISSTSELVQQQIDETYERSRADALETSDELCPNCQYSLEIVGKKENRFIIKCSRCGFTMVRKKGL